MKHYLRHSGESRNPVFETNSEILDSGSDRGREGFPSPPSEPCVRFSRTRLSSWQFQHRDWHARAWASVMVKSPRSAKKAFDQRICLFLFFFNHLPPLTPFSSAANMRSVQIEASTLLPVSVPCLAVAGTGDTILMLCLLLDFTHPPSCLPSLGTGLLSALFTAMTASVL